MYKRRAYFCADIWGHCAVAYILMRYVTGGRSLREVKNRGRSFVEVVDQNFPYFDFSLLFDLHPEQNSLFRERRNPKRGENLSQKLGEGSELKTGGSCVLFRFQILGDRSQKPLLLREAYLSKCFLIDRLST